MNRRSVILSIPIIAGLFASTQSFRDRVYAQVAPEDIDPEKLIRTSATVKVINQTVRFDYEFKRRFKDDINKLTLHFDIPDGEDISVVDKDGKNWDIDEQHSGTNHVRLNFWINSPKDFHYTIYYIPLDNNGCIDNNYNHGQTGEHYAVDFRC